VFNLMVTISMFSIIYAWLNNHAFFNTSKRSKALT
jgi:hypothetical protein